MANSLFIKADEVAELLGVSRAEAYRIIKRLNDQLPSRGFIVVNSRVNVRGVSADGRCVFRSRITDDPIKSTLWLGQLPSQRR